MTATAGEPSLVPAVSANVVMNGVTVSTDGRVFVSVQPQGTDTLEVAEVVGGKLHAYPDRRWNSWHEGDDARAAYVGVNALRIGPDGALWVVDKGSRGLGTAPQPGGAKVVRIDLRTGKATRTYDLTSVAGPGSFIDDIRFNGSKAYLTEVARGALIVLDLKTGSARTVLAQHPSLLGRQLIGPEGPLHFPNGKPVVANADQLEVSPGGEWLYFQPASGPMSRIATQYLDDPAMTDEMLGSHVQRFADTGPTGGTTIDGAGNIYLGDLLGSSIRRIDPSGRMTTVATDQRLIWPDAMWLDGKGFLWVPAAQLNRTRDLNGGRDTLRYPVRIYRLRVRGAVPN